MNRLILDFRNFIMIDEEEKELEAFVLLEIDKRKLLEKLNIINICDMDEIIKGDIIGIDFEMGQVVLYQLVKEYKSEEGYPIEELIPYKVFDVEME